MTDSEKIAMLKVMQEEQDEAVLSTYLFLAGRKIILRAFGDTATVEEVPSQYDSIQLEIAVYMLNKRGIDYQTSSSENGVSRGFESADVPESLLAAITPYARVHG